jgi:hypothetical protein
MSRSLKSLHLIALSLGFLSAVAVVINLAIFAILYPQVTQLLAEQPSWETYGAVAAINIILIAFYQLLSVIALLAHLISRKKTSTLVVAAIAIGIISGIMILGDITLLSDIGTEYEAGLQTRGEWWILFASYGLHILSLILGLLALSRNLNQDPKPEEQVLKDEVLFLSLHTTGVICGCLGLMGVGAAILSEMSLWMMERIVVVLGLLVLSPYLVTLAIWLFRRWWGESSPGLDEKQFQDLAGAGLRTLIISLTVTAVFFGFQLFPLAKEAWHALWFPLLIFLSLLFFSSLALRAYRYN